jgi:hypothetical protein
LIEFVPFVDGFVPKSEMARAIARAVKRMLPWVFYTRA